MDYQAETEARIADLEQQLAAMQRERAVLLQDRFCIGLTNEYEIEHYGVELLEEMRDLTGISFCSDDFAVLSFRGTSPDPGPRNTASICKNVVSPVYMRLRNLILLAADLRHVCIPCDKGGKIVCILNFSPDTQDFYDEIYALCDQINALVQKQFGFSFLVSVSELGQGVSSLPELSKQVSILDEYRAAIGEHVPSLLFYDQIASPEQQYPVVVQTMDKQFHACLDNGEFQNAKSLFREILLRDFTSSALPIHIVRLRLAAMIDYLVQSLYRSCDALGLSEVLREEHVSDTLSSCTSLDALLEASDRIFDVLTAKWQYTGTSVLLLAQTARTYIHDNYADPNLNVNHLAYLLKVSPTHLTRSFRTCYHCGVLEDLQRTRLSAAKQLLRAGRSIGEAAVQTGFGSSLNMGRAFKRYDGITPTEFLQSGR